jgi:hypothetical protein
MKKYAALALAAAAAFAVPAFAQSSVTSSTGASVSSGTGVVVTPSLPEQLHHGDGFRPGRHDDGRHQLLGQRARRLRTPG